MKKTRFCPFIFSLAIDKLVLLGLKNQQIQPIHLRLQPCLKTSKNA